MAQPKPPAVLVGYLELPSGQVIGVGDPGWFRWLDSSDARSFRFEGARGTFTARKEFPKAGTPYWAASRKLESRLHKRYLGHSATLTLDRLEEVAEKLANPEDSKSKRPKSARIVTHPTSPASSPASSVAENPDFQRLQAQVAELHKQVLRLQNSLGDYGGERSPDLGAVARLEEENREIGQQVAALAEERDALTRRNAELEFGTDELAARVEGLEAANQDLRQQLAAAVAERDTLEQENQEFRQQLAAAVAERDTLEQENREIRQQLTFQPAGESVPLRDLEVLRERVLAGLKLGRQAPGYKAAAKALAVFVEVLSSPPPKTEEGPAAPGVNLIWNRR